jgi:hypothetical protein
MISLVGILVVLASRHRTAAARNSTPRYPRLIKPFDCVAVGEATDKKNAAGIRIAAIGTPARASHFQKGESSATLWSRIQAYIKCLISTRWIAYASTRSSISRLAAPVLQTKTLQAR